MLKLPTVKFKPRRGEVKSLPEKEGQVMGLVYVDIELVSCDDLALHRHGHIKEAEIKRVKVSALVDSGAYMLCINEEIRTQLDLPFIETQVGELADKTTKKFDIVGPVEVRFENRSTSVRAVVLPGDAEVLLGSIPIEDMDVLIDPKQQRLIINPAHPYFAQKSLK